MNGTRASAVVAAAAAAVLLQAVVLCAAQDDGAGLKLHLPREVVVKDRNIRLGDIAVLAGNEALASKVQDIGLGTLTLSGQEVTLDRYTILTRLGSSGINVSDVELTGSDKVVVTLLRESITSTDLLATAEKFASQLPLPPDKRPHALNVPADVNVSESAGKVHIKATLVGGVEASPFIVKLTISRDGKELAMRQVQFAVVPRNARQAVAASRDEKSVVAKDSPKIVFRNRPVVIELAMPCLSLTAMGLPLEDGRAGQIIKVRNVDSKRDIMATVRPDGVVTPVI